MKNWRIKWEKYKSELLKRYNVLVRWFGTSNLNDILSKSIECLELRLTDLKIEFQYGLMVSIKSWLIVGSVDGLLTDCWRLFWVLSSKFLQGLTVFEFSLKIGLKIHNIKVKSFDKNQKTHEKIAMNLTLRENGFNCHDPSLVLILLY